MKNYVFPELATYKREWIPVLEVAKDLIERDEAKFVCTAVSESVSVCDTRQKRVKWTELIDDIKDAISDVIAGYITVSTWHLDTFGEPISSHEVPGRRAEAAKAYRLAWIDHIIKECKK